MPRGDEAILRQTTGLWAEGTAIRWLQQLRTTIAAGARRAKPLRVETTAPVATGRITAILVLGILAVSLVAYTLRQRAVSASAEPTALPRQDSPQAPSHPAHAAAEVQLPRPDAARAYPRSYNVLLSRSIFAANGVPSRRSAASSSTASPPPMATLSLKGISQEDARFTAFVEDATANRIFQVRLGDAIGPGRVCDITLHDLTYEVSGNRLRLEIDNISGKSGPPVPVPAMSTPRSGNDGANQDNPPPRKKKKKSES